MADLPLDETALPDRVLLLLAELRRAAPGVAWEPRSVISILGHVYTDVRCDRYSICRADLRLLERTGDLRHVANGWVVPVVQAESEGG